MSTELYTAALEGTTEPEPDEDLPDNRRTRLVLFPIRPPPPAPAPLSPPPPLLADPTEAPEDTVAELDAEVLETAMPAIRDALEPV